MRTVPHMVSVMTPFPYHISCFASLGEAEQLMSTHDIRHLPVMDGDDIVGIVSDRDLKRVAALGHRAADETELEVGDLCQHRPYLVDVADPLPEVLAVMVEKRIGAVIVLKDGELAGIFTATDACKLLMERLIRDHGPTPPGHEAA